MMTMILVPIIIIGSLLLLVSQAIYAHEFDESSKLRADFTISNVGKKKESGFNLRSGSKTLSDTEPAFYFAVKYPSSLKCEGESTNIYAYPLNVCKVGTAHGKVVGSGIEKINTNADNSQYLHTTYSQYSTLNCTGDVTDSYEIDYPDFCISNSSPEPEPFHFHSVSFELGPTSDVSSRFKNGVIISQYDTEEHCSSLSTSTHFTFVAFNQCMDGDSGTSFYFESCSGDAVNMKRFSDSQCNDPIEPSVLPLLTCETLSDDDDSSQGADDYEYSDDNNNEKEDDYSSYYYSPNTQDDDDNNKPRTQLNFEAFRSIQCV